MAVSDSMADVEARAGDGTVTRIWTVALVVLSLRAGSMLGLWPLALNPSGGVDRGNLTALAVHIGGALAVVGFFLARHKAGCLIGLAYTGYSTIALGLNNPREGLGVVIWVLGVLSMVGLGWALLRSPMGKPAPGLRARVLLAALVAVVSAAGMTALVFARL
jgi:hypothetical protein